MSSLFWLVFRTGTKPSRIVYPCQRAALANTSLMFSVFAPFSLALLLAKTKMFVRRRSTVVALLVVLAGAVVSSVQTRNFQLLVKAVNPNQELRLTLESGNATALPSSDIFVMNGRAHAHIGELLSLMGSKGLFFYRSNSSGSTQSAQGLIAYDDVVLIKINEEWPNRGGTNTDVLKELIQAIIDHPDGFVGEIVVADNGQWKGSMDWPESNAEDHTQSTQDVVDSFSSHHEVSTCSWIPIRSIRVDEYSAGNMDDGYILYENPDPETGIYVSYPKFRTAYGTYVSFKHGIWNGVEYENRLKIINMPVLKSHSYYGVTSALKHYMGVQSEGGGGQLGLGNGHEKVATGGMGTLMVETGLPTLNIVDAVWVNANPPPSWRAGPDTPYDIATRVNVLLASTDPVALDYWAAKHVLMQTAGLIGYVDVHTLDPDSSDKTGVDTEAFGVWLNHTKSEIQTAGYNVTTNVDRMNVYVSAQNVHDITVREVVLSETFVGQERVSVEVNVSVQNVGDFTEVFNLSLYADAVLVETKALQLLSTGSTDAVFSWNTTGWPEGNYAVRAYAWPVEGETNIVDNEVVYGIVWIPELVSFLTFLLLAPVTLLFIFFRRKRLLSRK